MCIRDSHVGAGHALTIGDDVTIGHSAIVHGCTVGNNTLIGMGAIILNGAVIGNNCIIGAGALVTQNMAVSYTHLDVYKRQRKNSRSGSRLKHTRSMKHSLTREPTGGCPIRLWMKLRHG